ncbi:DUF2971 domain-containing protein [Lederbergia citrea]|uniref:DUF2971 domain-containing protein n=1 Tax=Lederbergia citrea TaxID=2833581 RepID=UPI001BC9FA01|nr:DUF2971 domain-containing protein [Lederbergia citrea]MBS4203521.1 DUF2971 domain-containing protein [Lederbergia citrea]
MILYKFREDSEFTEAILNEDKVWLSKPENLNDPFECSIEKISKYAFKEKINLLKKQQIEAFCFGLVLQSSSGLINRKDADRITKRIGKWNSIEKKYEALMKYYDSIGAQKPTNPEDIYNDFYEKIKNIGIFSMTENVNQQLMWAHYANSHKGLAIGFEVSESSKLADPRFCLKVNYIDEIASFIGPQLKTDLLIGAQYKLQKVSMDDPTFQAVVSTKVTDWNYEEEWRYIELTSGSYKCPSKIKEIVFGLRCTEDVRKKYIQLGKKNNENINFYEMVKVENKNELMKNLIEFD